MKIHFKRLTPADAALLVQHPANWLPPYPPETLEPFLSEKDHYAFIGHTDTQVVAFLYGYALPRPDGRYMFYIHAVDVAPDFQGCGVGSSLMEFVLGELRKENRIYKFFLLAQKENSQACGLYRKFSSGEEQMLFTGEI